MKKLFLFLFPIAAAILVLVSTASCKDSKENVSALSEAETASDLGDYSRSFTIAREVLDSDDVSAMSIEDLCRMSLLLSRLSDRLPQSEEAIAYSALALTAAYDRNADSTLTVLNNFTPEEHEMIMVPMGIINGRAVIVDGDTLYISSDTIPAFPQ